MKPTTPIIPGVDLPVTVYAVNQPEYKQLPSFRSEDGMVLTRWRLSFRERVKLLFSGDLWLYVLTFNEPLQPVKLTTIRPVVGEASFN